MMDQEEIQLNKEMLAAFDKDMQNHLFYEEMGEVMTAMSHYRRGRCDLTSVLGEFADLQIMLNRMIVAYNLYDSYYECIYAKKLQKVRNLLKERKSKDNESREINRAEVRYFVLQTFGVDKYTLLSFDGLEYMTYLVCDEKPDMGISDLHRGLDKRYKDAGVDVQLYMEL